MPPPSRSAVLTRRDVGRTVKAWLPVLEQWEKTAWIASATQLFCLIGFLTRWAAFGLGALMLWQIIQYHGFYVFYRESHQLPFALFIMCFASFGLGGGKYSLDEKQKKKDG